MADWIKLVLLRQPGASHARPKICLQGMQARVAIAVNVTDRMHRVVPQFLSNKGTGIVEGGYSVQVTNGNYLSLQSTWNWNADSLAGVDGVFTGQASLVSHACCVMHAVVTHRAHA